VAVVIRDPIADVWTFDLATGQGARLAFSANLNDTPVWSPDGRVVSFAVPSILQRPEDDPDPPAGGLPTPAVLSARVDAPGPPTRVWTGRAWDGTEPVHLSAWSPDGRVLAGMQAGNLWLLDTAAPDGAGGSRAATRARLSVIQSPFANGNAVNDRDPVFSPDGRWMAYTSDRSGRNEVYVQSFPSLTDVSQISVNGGAEPVWSRDGLEIFYRQGQQMMAVKVRTQPSFFAASPDYLFGRSYALGPGGRTNYDTVQGPAGGRGYDVAADRQRFLMIKNEAPAMAAALRIVRHWPGRLPR
jgi:Tol biopolymer transport system component